MELRPRETSLSPGIVLGQFRGKGWFPAVAAPSMNQYGGNVTNGFPIALTAPAGTIYYTIDGSDPRLRGGAVSLAAGVYTPPLVANRSLQIKARVLNGAIWSPLAEA